MKVDNLRTMKAPGEASKGGVVKSLQHGGKDSLSGTNSTVEYRTKGGSAKSGAGGMPSQS